MVPAGPSILTSQLPRAFRPSSSAVRPSRRRSSIAENAQSRDGIGTTILSDPGSTTGLLRIEGRRPHNFDPAVFLSGLLDAGHIHGGCSHDLLGRGYAGAAVESLAATRGFQHEHPC